MEPHDGPDNDDREQDPADPHHDQPAAPAAPAAPATQPGPAAGNESVAAALAELGTIGQRPLAEHPDAFARVHGGLQQALSDIDDA